MLEKQTNNPPVFPTADPDYLSQKLRIFSLILMVMVVFIHAYNLNVSFDDAATPATKSASGRTFSWAAYIQEFISDGICRVAVPFFFMISAFFLFAKYSPNYTFSHYLQVLKKRIRTLVFPFLLVSIGGLALVVVLQQLPGTDAFFRAYKLENFTLKLILFKLFYLPVSYQLWFISYLLVCVLVSPVIYFFIRYTGIFYLFALLVFWIDYNLQYQLKIPQIQVETLLSFSLGAYIAIKKIQIPRIQSRWFAWLFLALWIGTTLLRTMYKFQTWSFAEVHYWLKLAIFFGILAMWSGYDVWFSKLGYNKAWLHVASFNFGIYLFHEPTLTIFKKLAIRFAGSSELSLLLIYCMSGLAAILFSYYLSKGWKKYFPASFSVVTGGR